MTLFDSAQARNVRNLIYEWVDRIPEPDRYSSIGLYDGAALYALFLAQAGLVLQDRKLVARAHSHADFGIAQLKDVALNTSLISNVTGLGFALDKLRLHADSSPSLEFPLAQIDEVLCEATESLPFGVLADLLNGLAGVVVYGANRSRVEDSLGKDLVLQLWRWLSAEHETRWGEGVYSRALTVDDGSDLTIAHGYAGVLAAFSRAYVLGALPLAAGPLLRVGFERLCAQRLRSDVGPLFPSRSGTGAAARIGWCTGSVGFAAALLHGRSVISTISADAAELLESMIRQYDSPMAKVYDGALCHGLSGVSYMFWRASKAAFLTSSLRASLFDVSKRAVDQLLGTVGKRHPAGHYPIEGFWQDADTILEGGYGVCLALLAMLEGGPAIWEDVFLLDFPRD